MFATPMPPRMRACVLENVLAMGTAAKALCAARGMGAALRNRTPAHAWESRVRKMKSAIQDKNAGSCLHCLRKYVQPGVALGSPLVPEEASALPWRRRRSLCASAVVSRAQLALRQACNVPPPLKAMYVFRHAKHGKTVLKAPRSVKRANAKAQAEKAPEKEPSWER